MRRRTPLAVLVAALFLVTMIGRPAAAQSFPFPLPDPRGGGLPFPIPGGGGFPFPIPDSRGGGFPFPIPIPGGPDLGRLPSPGDGGSDILRDIITSIIVSSQRRPPTDTPPPRYPPRLPDVGPRIPSGPAPGPDAPVGGRPDGYDVITSQGRVARIAPEVLPFRIAVGKPAYQDVLDSALSAWNGGGLGTLLTAGPAQDADLTLDWSGAHVAPGARAETRFVFRDDAVVPTGISIRPDGRSRGDLAQVLAHELGHVLGLDHSAYRSDLMYRSEQRSGRAALSSRDRQMLQWVYAQREYVAIRGRGWQGVAGRSLRDDGLPEPGCSVCTHP